MTKIPNCYVKQKQVKYSKIGLEKSIPKSVHFSLIEIITMVLNLDTFLTKTFFIFLKFYFIFLQLIWQNDNFYVLNAILPSSEEYPPIPHYWVILSDFTWEWRILLFQLIIQLVFRFRLIECVLCKNTPWLSCIYEISI